MKIPTSAFVMGLLTLGLFGLAVRETVAHKAPEPNDDDGEGYAPESYDDRAEAKEQARLLAEAEQAEAEAAAASEKVAEKRKTAVATLVGAELASLGSLFDGVTLGKPVPDGLEDRLRAFQADTDVEVDLHVTAAGLQGLDLQLHRGGQHLEDSIALCSVLDKRLTELWGQSVPGLTDEVQHWFNPATGQRATLSEERWCSLTIERAVTEATWLATSPRSIVPLWAIGQPVAKLTAALPASAEIGMQEVTWAEPGLGAGDGPTSLTAELANGKIERVIVEADVAPATRDHLSQYLTTKFGKGTGDEQRRSWRGKPPLELQLDTSRSIRLIVGKPVE